MAINLFREAARFFISNNIFEPALQNASMVLKLSQQLGSAREQAWGLFLSAVSTKGLENEGWQPQIEEAKNLAQEINDGHLDSLISTFLKTNK